jgi:hypothetical protein
MKAICTLAAAVLAAIIVMSLISTAHAQCANGVCTMPQQPPTVVYHYGQYGPAYATPGFYSQQVPRRVFYSRQQAPVRYFLRQRPVRQMMCGPFGCR